MSSSAISEREFHSVADEALEEIHDAVEEALEDGFEDDFDCHMSVSSFPHFVGEIPKALHLHDGAIAGQACESRLLSWAMQ